MIWERISKEIVGSHTYQGNNKNERFDKVLHIHGTLEDNEMLIGVNDESQIENTELLYIIIRMCFLCSNNDYDSINKIVGNIKNVQ